MNPNSTRITIWNPFLQDFNPWKCITYLKAVQAKTGNMMKGPIQPTTSKINVYASFDAP